MRRAVWMNFEEVRQEKVEEIEKILKKYLPAEVGVPEDSAGGHELQCPGRRKASAPHADAGNLPYVRRRRTSCGAFHGGHGNDTHVFPGP